MSSDGGMSERATCHKFLEFGFAYSLLTMHTDLRSLRLTLLPDAPAPPADETLLRVACGAARQRAAEAGLELALPPQGGGSFAEVWSSDRIGGRGAAGAFRWVRCGGRPATGPAANCSRWRAHSGSSKRWRWRTGPQLGTRLSTRNPVDPRFLYALPARCVNAEAAAFFAAGLERGLRRILAAMLAIFLLVTSEFLLAVLLGRWANSAAAADFSALLE